MYDISTSLVKRLAPAGKKRILSLDGGGLKGAITLGFLTEMENQLAKRHAAEGIMDAGEFRLHHYFDLIGGTSTGAIIAALLAVKGYSASEVSDLYRQLGGRIFSDRNGFNILGKRISFYGKYDSTPLKEELEAIFKDDRLGDDSNKTGLCVVTKRLDTCSTWPVTNNPSAIYFSQNRFLIKDIVRASTAAPSYFEPEIIDVGSQQQAIFVDGGMSMMNNPSLQLFLVATLDGYRLNWNAGQDDLFIVSVGTGRRDKKLVGNKWNNPNLIDIAKMAPEQFMTDAGELIEIMMHYIGKATGPLRTIDSEIQDLSKDTIHGGKAFSYLRYNVELAEDPLKDIGMNPIDKEQLASLTQMDLSENLDLLMKIGAAAGKAFVKAEHFPACFNLTAAPVADE
jgi:predicted acylesterase/phospholipase RssA